MSRKGLQSQGSGRALAIDLVEASLPFTQGIDFGYVCVGKQYTRTFTIANTAPFGSVGFNFKRAEDENFLVTPMQGIVGPKQKKEITVTFNADEAKVLIAAVVINLSQGETERSRVIKMSAMSKFPFIVLNKDEIDFESLLVGKTMSHRVTVKNSSLVQTNIKVEKIKDDEKDSSFSTNFTEGVLPPHSEAFITIEYKPQVAGTISCCYYRITSDGGNELSLSCKGEAEGFSVQLSANSVQFGEVSNGNSSNRLINVVNTNDMPATFQFMADKNNLFSFSQTEGTIKPYSFTRIIVTFIPPKTGNFYERVFCLIRNHRVLYVDLMGTCFDILTKPIPLMQRHIDAQRHKVIMGTHLKASKGDLLEYGFERTGMSSKVGFQQSGYGGGSTELNLEIPIDDPNQIVLHKEMLHGSVSQTKDVRFSTEHIDFGFTDNGRLSEGRQITLKNRYKFKVRANWHLISVIDKKTGKIVPNPFRVTPEEMEINPDDTATFNVDFAPYEPDSYFFQIGQCFINLLNGNDGKNKKLTMNSLGGTKSLGRNAAKTLLGSMKTSRYADFSGEEIDPPLCQSVRLCGHSFAPGSQPFIPMIKMSQREVVFSPCSPGESVFQTVLVQNSSDTPVLFKAMQDSSNTFKSYPSLGLIPGKSFALICLEFSPRQTRTYSFTCQFLFNNSAANIQSVLLTGTCYAPGLELAQDTLFFSPSYIGVSTRQKFSVKNESRIPVTYEWRVPDKYKSEVIFNPQCAILLPAEEVKVFATFTPLKKKQYSVVVPIFARNQFDRVKNFVGFFNPGSGKSLVDCEGEHIGGVTTVRKEITIVGAGSDGGVAILPKLLDFGTITVGFNKTLQFIVSNNSSCNLFIRLKMVPINPNADPEKAKIIQQVLDSSFRFDSQKGLVNSKSKKKVNVTFKPHQRFDFDTQLVCLAGEKMAKEVTTTQKIALALTGKKDISHLEKCAIPIKCKGDYPLVRVTDVRNEQVSIANLWERFNLTNMNKELLKPLTEHEFTYNNSDKSNQSQEELTANLSRFSWDFGKIPARRGKEPRRITITLKNVGGVAANWCFKLPNDSDIEMEPWVDTGNPSSEQAFEKMVLDQNIFKIEPRSGTLEPGEQRDLCISYFPRDVCKHHLNTFFQIQNGKPLIVRMEGETLDRRACLQLLKHTYEMPAVPIGMEKPVQYPIEIKNLGITKLKYTIELRTLEKLNQKNYDFRVLDILNPYGEVRPGETKHIQALFQPLEAKNYELDLPIKVEDIEGLQKVPTILRLRGLGYQFEDKKPEEVQFYEDLPLCRANLNDNGSMAAFSMESIDFGELVYGEPSRRFVILYNLNTTQKCNFNFDKTAESLICGDTLRLEPMKGELKPNSHVNIKMTLIPSRLPTHFEGEIQCSIDWERHDGDKIDTVSCKTTTALPEPGEYLFLRLKKRSQICKVPQSTDLRDNENLLENVMHEAMHDILESDEFDQMLDNIQKSNTGLYASSISNQPAPKKEVLKQKGHEQNESEEEDEDMSEEQEDDLEFEAVQPKYEEMLRDVSAVDESEMARKRMFTKEPFVDLMEFMLEDTLFNLMEEATFQEFDLTQPPKIYIRKN